MKKIGVLDIQGSVEEHFLVLQKLSSKYNFFPVLVKTKKDLANLSGLIIPGGESTVIGQLLVNYQMSKEIIKLANRGMAVYGTCAGAILLAKEVGDKKIKNLGLIDLEIKRNAYGRQLDSFETKIKFNNKKIPVVFIRAPKLVKIGKKVEVLAKCEEEVVAVRQKNILITTFHPELTDSVLVHDYFVKMCK